MDRTHSEGALVAQLAALDESGWARLLHNFPDEARSHWQRIRDLLPEATRRTIAPDTPIDEAAALALQHTRRVFDALPVGILVTDQDGNIIDCNRASERMLGLSRREHLERVVHKGWEVYDETGRTMPPERYASVEALRTRRAVYDRIKQVVTPSGRVWLSVCALPVFEAGIGVIVTYSDITDLIDARKMVERLASVDEVTGLPNRTNFLRRLGESIGTAAGHKQIALVLVDLKHFAEINEAHGHAVGDAALRMLSGRLLKVFGPDSHLSRLYADGFAALLPLPVLDETLEQALGSVSRPLEAEGCDLRLEARAGVAVYPNDSDAPGELLKFAEVALWRGKQTNDRITFFNRSFSEQVMRRLSLSRALVEALDHDQLELHYQTQVALDSRRITGAEALLRWRHPEQGWVSPGEFLPVAETRGLMPRLGHWVIEAACRQLVRWREAGITFPGRLAVNISPSQFDEPDFVTGLLDIARKHGVAPAALELEITEQAMVGDPDRAVKLIAQLREHGFAVAIDDFGMGYSSLTQLKRFPLNRLKIDQSFVREMVTHERDRIIVETIVGMADTLGMSCVAEGVETEQQRSLLLEMGCREAQGWLFGKAVTADELAAALRPAPGGG